MCRLEYFFSQTMFLPVVWVALNSPSRLGHIRSTLKQFKFFSTRKILVMFEHFVYVNKNIYNLQCTAN